MRRAQDRVRSVRSRKNGARSAMFKNSRACRQDTRSIVVSYVIGTAVLGTNITLSRFGPNVTRLNQGNEMLLKTLWIFFQIIILHEKTNKWTYCLLKKSKYVLNYRVLNFQYIFSTFFQFFENISKTVIDIAKVR